MKKILLIRFSAMGDVILTAQVARSALLENPELHLYVLTRPVFMPFFMPVERITFIEVDLNGRHKGFLGLFRLANEAASLGPFEAVLDLHNVLRTRILSFFFGLRRIPVFTLSKDRKGRKALTRKKGKDLNALKPILASMKEVWQKAGFQFSLMSIGRKQEQVKVGRIGIAPTASTKTKTYPLNLMAKLIQMLIDEGFGVFLFGGGKKDEDYVKKLCEKVPKEKISSFIGTYSLEQQMQFMQSMQLMLTMDSSNMHLARYLDVPVLSIWGATHPYAGYGPFNQDDPSMFIQVSTESLSCRPCSVFGQKNCFRDRLYCLENISPTQVFDSIKSHSSNQ